MIFSLSEGKFEVRKLKQWLVSSNNWICTFGSFLKLRFVNKLICKNHKMDGLFHCLISFWANIHTAFFLIYLYTHFHLYSVNKLFDHYLFSNNSRSSIFILSPLLFKLMNLRFCLSSDANMLSRNATISSNSYLFFESRFLYQSIILSISVW